MTPFLIRKERYAISELVAETHNKAQWLKRKWTWALTTSSLVSYGIFFLSLPKMSLFNFHNNKNIMRPDIQYLVWHTVPGTWRTGLAQFMFLRIFPFLTFSEGPTKLSRFPLPIVDRPTTAPFDPLHLHCERPSPSMDPYLSSTAVLRSRGAEIKLPPGAAITNSGSFLLTTSTCRLKKIS